ncbi:unnamed protein product [Urochloa humidicola]
MDMQTMLMLGGDINQAPTMPPYVPPPPLICGSDHNQFAGYGCDLGDGIGGHDAADEMEGYYGTATTCNFFSILKTCNFFE